LVSSPVELGEFVSLIISSICSLVFVGSEVTSLELLDSFSLSEEEFSSLEDFS